MSLTLKLSSLFIRTAAKPIGNYIKSQAREHERFRKVCVSFAQRLHRIDMRLRIGLLQDPAAIERQVAREEAAEQRKKAIPTVATADEAKKAKEEHERRVADGKSKSKNRMIRPLSEAKAIDSGANFISETFLFLVAGGLIVFESWRSRRKEATRREDVKERLEALEEIVRGAREAEEEDKREIGVLRAEVERLQNPTSAARVDDDDAVSSTGEVSQEKKKKDDVHREDGADSKQTESVEQEPVHSNDTR